jgi:hypothetical protein
MLTPQPRAKVHNDTYNGGYQGDDSADTGGDDGNDGFKGGSSKPRQRDDTAVLLPKLL